MGTMRVLPGGRVMRYTLAERLVHSVAGASYVYLLLTGLAFWSPWLFWMAVMLGGGQVSRALHPWAGLVFTGAVVQMYRMWKKDMQAAPEDAAWVAAKPVFG